MPRGGRRAGAPGKVYQNRSDMTAGATAQPGQPLPVTAAPNQPYGVAGAQRASQAAVPMMSAPPVAGVMPPVGSPQQAGPPSLGLPAGGIEPGELPPLHAPTDRPGEHLMTGVNAGPGAGSEALNLPPQTLGAAPQSTAQFLAALAAQPGAPGDIVALAQAAGRSG